MGNGLLATTNRVELPLLYIASALCLALTGPGAYSIDAALGLSASWTPLVIAIVLLSGVLGGLATLGLRRSAPVVAHA